MLSNRELPKMAYSLQEASTACSLSRSTLYRLIADGALCAVKVGGRTLIPAASLQRLFAEHQN